MNTNTNTTHSMKKHTPRLAHTHLFTSESVSDGHPDKIADQISDAILDAIIAQDSNARVACETLVKTGMVFIAGEISTHAWVDIEAITRKVINDIGYSDAHMGFDGDSCAVLNAIGKQSPDIATGVDHTDPEDQGAGDQGMMFGYATNETEVYMPAALHYAHKIMQHHAYIRKNKQLDWLRPDAKCQITLRYENHQPIAIDTIVLSTQHAPHISQSILREAVIEEIIKPILPNHLDHKNIQYLINPTGQFIIGGPQGDCGLTGRKIIVDTYGGAAKHGGGAFSGKDPSKVDRSGAYMARYVAKNIVAAQLADRCEIQISYAIGITKPTSIMVDTFGTGKLSDARLADIICEVFDLRPYAISQQLNLLRPIYQKTATYGHFGRTDEESFTWEHLNKIEILSSFHKNT